MATEYQDLLELFQPRANHSVLHGICHGIERESLRVTSDARLSQKRHPEKLGRALTHPYITTDYSEALLEFITPVHCRIDDTLSFLEQLHQYANQHIDGELLWSGSMPPLLEGDDSIPIAHYGSSNIGVMKSIYREGLWHRYGKPMQTIAGIHYNFSLPEAFWALLRQYSGQEEINVQDFRSAGYFSLIRNFLRYSWLLMYLFGASPAVSRSFFADGGAQSGLQSLDKDSLYLPYATSLRMSDMGYSNHAQSSLNICYNTLEDYVDSLSSAIRTPYPPYEAIGLKKNGQYLQLNTNLLQIENEYYSTIRPKRIARSGEKPVTALRNEGVEYVEVRCLDINPFEPLGLNELDAHFLDIFLVYCSLQGSDPIDADECAEASNNFKTVVMEGRRPGVALKQKGQSVVLQDRGLQLLDDMSPIAEMLDQANESSTFVKSLHAQREKLNDASLTPSAQLLNTLETEGFSYIELMMSLSEKHAKSFSGHGLSDERLAYFEQVAQRSIADQLARENNDRTDFDAFLQAYMAAE
ncbi:glutamate--cysteine ligase [Endozoicomonas sp. SCSIO W0465]|uniref:glutamate--cysteine ligase n=1 Tax=Endozoicomonas sp. SCSIO W0465 TaxID=2918516 RepID=UPI002075D161|nr:glutamate--cysteine ligase [Endozoicomonas sp. SCSIO W0465]USE36572.1 glutamate--cysteine ligase [Endozoicomonas sp. SCSIO W0465]